MFEDIKDDVEFTEKLVAEQSVFCLPAQVYSPTDVIVYDYTSTLQSPIQSSSKFPKTANSSLCYC